MVWNYQWFWIPGAGELLPNNLFPFSESEALAMGSRMNPECKIYIGGLPDDANKSDMHFMIYPFYFLIPNVLRTPPQNDPTWPWKWKWRIWIMTITPPARPYAHLSAQAFSYATPQLQWCNKSNASKLRCNYKATHRVASLHLAHLNLSKNLAKAPRSPCKAPTIIIQSA